VDGSIPVWLNALVLSLLSKDLHRRPKSAAEVAMIIDKNLIHAPYDTDFFQSIDSGYINILQSDAEALPGSEESPTCVVSNKLNNSLGIDSSQLMMPPGATEDPASWSSITPLSEPSIEARKPKSRLTGKDSKNKIGSLARKKKSAQNSPDSAIRESLISRCSRATIPVILTAISTVPFLFIGERAFEGLWTNVSNSPALQWNVYLASIASIVYVISLGSIPFLFLPTITKEWSLRKCINSYKRGFIWLGALFGCLTIARLTSLLLRSSDLHVLKGSTVFELLQSSTQSLFELLFLIPTGTTYVTSSALIPSSTLIGTQAQLSELFIHIIGLVFVFALLTRTTQRSIFRKLSTPSAHAPIILGLAFLVILPIEFFSKEYLESWWGWLSIRGHSVYIGPFEFFYSRHALLSAITNTIVYLLINISILSKLNSRE
ncbi:MAG: hypothetical protein KDD53_03510, partial [Bdellovibrionales bacterium]|nr:hypothetical protein [Bdellovibrionales bacterium]